jgi:hypothetical protein
LLRRFEFGVGHAAFDLDVKALVGVVGFEAGDHVSGFGDDPRWGHRHHPAGFRAARLQAVEIRLGAVAVLVVLDAQPGDLRIHYSGNFTLCALDLGAPLGAGADDVQGAPGQHAGHGV